MAKIHYLYDENGIQHVFGKIAIIAKKKMENDGYANLTKYIAQALEYLEDIGIPDKKLLPFETKREDSKPLMEFRVNWRGTGYFRLYFSVLKIVEGKIFISQKQF